MIGAINVMRLPVATPTQDVLTAVATERARQDRLKAAGRFKYTCADLGLSDPERLAVLAEEFGEVSREVAEGVAGKPVDSAKLRAELVQVAAVAAAWVEFLDRETLASQGA